MKRRLLTGSLLVLVLGCAFALAIVSGIITLVVMLFEWAGRIAAGF